MRPLLFLLIPSIACFSNIDDDDDPRTGGKTDDPSAMSCAADESGNGQCNTRCEVPDLDCYRIFESPSAASDFYQQVMRPTGLLIDADTLTENTPEAERVQALFDEGWRGYSSLYDMGELPKPQLVILDDRAEPQPNAFVTADSLEGVRVAWTVIVLHSLIEQNGDDELMAVLFHELEHAARLHTVGDVGERIARYYVRDAGEPKQLGRLQTDNPTLGEPGRALVRVSQLVGSFSFEELGGAAANDSALGLIILELLEGDALSCFDASLLYEGFELVMAQSPSFAVLAVPPDADALADLATDSAEFGELLLECAAGDSRDLVDVLHERFGRKITRFRSDHAQAIQGLPIAQQLLLLSERLYAEMRSHQQAILDYGVTLEQVRFFSTEEAADDSATRLMNFLGRKGDALADFFHRDLGDEEQPCEAMLASPSGATYGTLTSSHHSPCWRIGHTREVSALFAAGELE